jgi:hypothetical protein
MESLPIATAATLRTSTPARPQMRPWKPHSSSSSRLPWCRRNPPHAPTAHGQSRERMSPHDPICLVSACLLAHARLQADARTCTHAHTLTDTRARPPARTHRGSAMPPGPPPLGRAQPKTRCPPPRAAARYSSAARPPKTRSTLAAFAGPRARSVAPVWGVEARRQGGGRGGIMWGGLGWRVRVRLVQSARRHVSCH